MLHIRFRNKLDLHKLNVQNRVDAENGRFDSMRLLGIEWHRTNALCTLFARFMPYESNLENVCLPACLSRLLRSQCSSSVNYWQRLSSHRRVVVIHG